MSGGVRTPVSHDRGSAIPNHRSDANLTQTYPRARVCGCRRVFLAHAAHHDRCSQCFAASAPRFDFRGRRP